MEAALEGERRGLETTMSDDNDNPLLDVIRRKERQLGELLELAEKQAKDKVAAARQRAITIRQEAEIIGQREAEQFYQDQINLAQAAAAQINAKTTREAEDLARRGDQQLERAVQMVIEFILPK